MKHILFFISLCLAFSAHAKDDVFDIARSGDNAKLALYIEAGGNLNLVNNKGFTPFILAAYYNKKEVVELLLDHHVDPCSVDNSGNNAFMGVAFKGHVSMAKWLLDNTNCSINHRNYAGQTALMMAALFDHEALVQLFIKNGANASLKDFQGNSAESLAAAQGLQRIVDIVRFSLMNS